MINAKAKFIIEYSGMVDLRVNEFLKTIDVRQIIKIELGSLNDNRITCLITYLELDDIRESKIESILDKKYS
jgi:hypothetical protein